MTSTPVGELGGMPVAGVIADTPLSTSAVTSRRAATVVVREPAPAPPPSNNGAIVPCKKWGISLGLQDISQKSFSYYSHVKSFMAFKTPSYCHDDATLHWSNNRAF